MIAPLEEATWLVIPLYNEGAVVGDVIKNALEVFPHIVCVDDGSADGSGDIALRAGAVVLTHPINLGQGAALQTGLTFALSYDREARYFVTFDSDGQHRTEDVQRMIRRLDRDELDVVLGSRFLDEGTNMTRLKRTVLKTAVAFENFTTGLKLTDAHNGLRAFTRRGAEKIHITQNRMAHASEITSQIARAKLLYAEEPVHIQYTDYSMAKGQSVWNAVNILGDLWLR
ncbi:glycosyltransferase [Pseudoclavibacter soli]|uniref:glycosyltransferase n=1 Tax=Pseudoclavibacter soli TaxID=452623 RepID=UPI0004876907